MKKATILLIFFTVLMGCTKKETVPIYDYYKNIPVMRGWTDDEIPKNMIVEVVLVYRENNNELRTSLNILKPRLIDALRNYFARLKEEDYLLENQENIKMEAVMILNEVILDSYSPKKAEKLRKRVGLEELDLLLDIDIMQLQIFSLD